MDKIEITIKDYNELADNLNDLSKLLSERISDLYEMQGGKQARHAFQYYRDFVLNAQGILRGINPSNEIKL